MTFKESLKLFVSWIFTDLSSILPNWIKIMILVVIIIIVFVTRKRKPIPRIRIL